MCPYDDVTIRKVLRKALGAGYTIKQKNWHSMETVFYCFDWLHLRTGSKSLANDVIVI